MAFENAADAFRAYPGMWPTPDAAKKALQREPRTGTISNKYLLIGECPCPLVTVAYQRAAAGAKRAICRVDLSIVPDPAAWLSMRLGKLAWCNIEQPPPPEPDIRVSDIRLPDIATAPDHAAGLDPGLLYRPGVLEPPPAFMLTIRRPGGHARAEIEVPAFGPYMSACAISMNRRGPDLVMPHPAFLGRVQPPWMGAALL